MPIAVKKGIPNLMIYLSNKRMFKKIFKGKMFLITSLKTLLQIFSDFAVYSQVFFKSIIDPDDNVGKDYKAWMGSAEPR